MNDRPPMKTQIGAFFNGRAASYHKSEMHRWLAGQTVRHMNLPKTGIFLQLAAGAGGLASREIAARVDPLQSRFIVIDLASELLAVSIRS